MFLSFFIFHYFCNVFSQCFCRDQNLPSKLCRWFVLCPIVFFLGKRVGHQVRDIAKLGSNYFWYPTWESHTSSASSISGSSLVWWSQAHCEFCPFRVWFFFSTSVLSFLFSHSLLPGVVPLFIYLFIGSCGLYGIGSNFWKFYIIQTGFTLRMNWFFWWKCFKLFRSGGIFLVFRACTQCINIYLLARPMCLC